MAGRSLSSDEKGKCLWWRRFLYGVRVMEDPKKLIRGLKYISPLFGAVSDEIPVHHSPEVQVLAVSSPDCEGDSLLLNTFFASQIASSGKACTLLSILSRCGKGFLEAENRLSEPFGDH